MEAHNTDLDGLDPFALPVLIEYVVSFLATKFVYTTAKFTVLSELCAYTGPHQMGHVLLYLHS